MAYTPPPPPPPSEITEVLQAPESLERKIIVGCYQSFRFYRVIREIICPILDPKTGKLRPDFSVISYNKIFALVNSMFRMWDHITPASDFGVQNAAFENYLFDRVQRGVVSKDEAIALFKEITYESAQMQVPVEELRALPDSHVFRAWLQNRVVSNEIKLLSNTQMLRAPTMSDIQLAVQRAEKSISAGQSKAVNAAAALLGNSKYSRPILTQIAKLDAALGGGVRFGDTTAVCAPTAGGKTVLAMQLAITFAQARHNTVVVTTEQPPEQLIARAVSNHLDYAFAEFTNRRDISPDLKPEEEIDLENIPAFLWTDPIYGPRMHAFYDFLMNHLYFIDWSQGQGSSIAGSLDNDINALAALGWDPRVVIVDWVGGGLAPQTDQKDLRIIYKEAAEAVIRHGKRHRRAMFLMAQADKVLANERTKAITVKMVSECKSMVDNCANFIGVSAMREAEQAQGTKTRLSRRQFLNVDKSRFGPGGLVPVEQCFHVQRFQNVGNHMTGGESQS